MVRRLPEDLLGGIAEQPFCACVPGADPAIQRFCDDGVFRGFHDRRHTLERLLGLLPPADVLEENGNAIDGGSDAHVEPALDAAPEESTETAERLDR